MLDTIRCSNLTTKSASSGMEQTGMIYIHFKLIAILMQQNDLSIMKMLVGLSLISAKVSNVVGQLVTKIYTQE